MHRCSPYVNHETWLKHSTIYFMLFRNVAWQLKLIELVWRTV